MFTNPLNDDKLGIGLRQRAKEAHRAFETEGRDYAKSQGQLVSFGQLGPLRDPMWDAYFQALDEQGVSKMAGGSLTSSPVGYNPAGSTGRPDMFAMRALRGRR